MRTRFGRASLCGALVLASVGLIGVSADATVIHLEPFAGADAWTYSDCGYPIHVEAEFEGTARIRVGKQQDASAFFLLERLSYREVHTNVLTGEWFVLRGDRTFNEVKATRVEGTVFEFTQHEAGQPFVVEDAAGRVVARDRGVIEYRVVFDTEGDDQPGGQFVEFLGADVRGPHPGFDNDLCRFAGELVGIGSSSQRITLHPKGKTSAPAGYGEYLPPDYDDPSLSPLLVFLHGSGESGDGSEEELLRLGWNGIPRYIAYDGWPDDRPFVVLAPQHEVTGDLSPYAACDSVEFPGSCALTVQHDLGNPAEGSVCFTPAEIEGFLSYAIAAYDVDPQRVYLTGLSCGGFGGWEYVAEHGGSQIAAWVPVAGEGRPAWQTAGCGLGDVAIWGFHGLADDIVEPAGTIEPITQLHACPPGKDALLTTYPDAGHDSWTATYAVGGDHDIYTWMLGITKP